MIFAVVAIATAFVTWFASLVVYRFALRFHIHPPVRERDVHARPTPRLGGVAMFVGVVFAFVGGAFVPQLSALYAQPERIAWLLGAVAFIVVIGVLDDLYDLDWMIKLGAQVLAASAVAYGSVQIVALPIAGLIVGSSTMSFILTVLTIVLVMNAVNFIDGLDGLVAGVTIIGSATFFAYTWILRNGLAQENAFFSLASLISAVVIGACVGFLPLNWHPAKMFMGDAGALMIGMLTAASAIAVTGQIDVQVVGGRSQILPAFIPILLPFSILLMPLLDFVLAVIRRLANGQSPFAADRKHLHHRLLDMGHSHLGAVLIFYCWTAVVSIGCLLFMPTPWWHVQWWQALIIIAVGFLVSIVLTAAPVSRRVARSFLRLVKVRRAERRLRSHAGNIQQIPIDGQDDRQDIVRQQHESGSERP